MPDYKSKFWQLTKEVMILIYESGIRTTRATRSHAIAIVWAGNTLAAYGLLQSFIVTTVYRPISNSSFLASDLTRLLTIEVWVLWSVGLGMALFGSSVANGWQAKLWLSLTTLTLQVIFMAAFIKFR